MTKPHENAENPHENAEDGLQNEFQTDTYRFTIDRSRRPSLSIIEELAACFGCEPTDLEPLYYDIDPEVLDRLATEANVVEFRFVSNGVVVTVRNDSVVFEPANG